MKDIIVVIGSVFLWIALLFTIFAYIAVMWWLFKNRKQSRSFDALEDMGVM